MQYNVYYRYNINSSLRNFFNFDEKLSKNNSINNYPELIFKLVAKTLQDNQFWILDKKFEVLTNVRVTQRLVIENNIKNIQLDIKPEIIKKIKTTNLKYIDSYSDYHPDFENNKILPNNYEYDKKKCK